VRAILGQQVSVAAASTLAGRLAARFGTPIPDEAGGGEGLTTAFPSPAALAGADIAAIGLPRARAAALAGLAAAAAADPALFSPYGAPEAAAVRLRALPGIGEWTAQYVAMRVLREPDAFPASDLGLLRAVASLTGAAVRPSPGELLARAEAWRPWRAYAALHLWAADAAQAPPVRRAGRRAA
jgi:AraC family transcriptional regulator of adaptative response / DNA-3-methyladenine glycosylase II